MARPQLTTILTAAQRRQIATTLNDFYARPVARVSFELVLTIITVLFFAVFAIRPTLLTMSDLIKELEEKRELDTKLTQKIASLNTAQNQYLNLEDRLSILEEAIPNQPELVTALQIIEKVASDRGLAITSLGVSEYPEDTASDVPVSDLTRQNILVSLTVTGDYPTIRQLIEDLRASRRIFVVDSVNFTTSDQRGQKLLRTTININVPYYGVSAATKETATRGPTTPVVTP